MLTKRKTKDIIKGSTKWSISRKKKWRKRRQKQWGEAKRGITSRYHNMDLVGFSVWTQRFSWWIIDALSIELLALILRWFLCICPASLKWLQLIFTGFDPHLSFLFFITFFYFSSPSNILYGCIDLYIISLSEVFVWFDFDPSCKVGDGGINLELSGYRCLWLFDRQDSLK